MGAHYARDTFNIGAAYTQLNNPFGIYAFDPYAMIGTRTFLGQPTVSVDPATGAVTDLYEHGVSGRQARRVRDRRRYSFGT